MTNKKRRGYNRMNSCKNAWNKKLHIVDPEKFYGCLQQYLKTEGRNYEESILFEDPVTREKIKSFKQMIHIKLIESAATEGIKILDDFR